MRHCLFKVGRGKMILILSYLHPASKNCQYFYPFLQILLLLFHLYQQIQNLDLHNTLCFFFRKVLQIPSHKLQQFFTKFKFLEDFIIVVSERNLTLIHKSIQMYLVGSMRHTMPTYLITMCPTYPQQVKITNKWHRLILNTSQLQFLLKFQLQKILQVKL